jgi:hypothetical protein
MLNFRSHPRESHHNAELRKGQRSRKCVHTGVACFTKTFYGGKRPSQGPRKKRKTPV